MLNRIISIKLCLSIILTMTAAAIADDSVSFTHFRGTTVDGKSISTTDYDDSVLLIDFWASWCTPCVQEMPDIVNLHRQYKGKGFKIITVSVDQAGAKDKVAKAVNDLGMNWPVIYDGRCWKTPGIILNSVSQIPMTFLIDRNGKPRYAGLRQEQLRNAVIELINEK